MLQKVVIIGAGPAGLLLAHRLLRRGKYCIELYEQRSDPHLVDVSQDRTFPISLQERGRKALRLIAGLEEAIVAAGVFCNGTNFYRRQGKVRQIPRTIPILTIDRNCLVRILLQHLTQAYASEQLTVRFSCQCVSTDWKTKSITLKPEQDEAFTIQYDYLIAADGARSLIRDDLVQNIQVQCEQSYVPDAYKSVFLNRLNPALGLELEPDKIHGSSSSPKVRMLMVPQPGDQLNGVIIFDADQNPLSSLTTPAEVLPFFQENFPVFGQLMSPEAAEAFWHRPVADINGSVRSLSCRR
ncbi:MAG TPA: FAD-dependent monooxygenase [Stenomitos sp.]